MGKGAFSSGDSNLSNASGGSVEEVSGWSRVGTAGRTCTTQVQQAAYWIRATLIAFHLSRVVTPWDLL